MTDFDGFTVLVTGASTGLGRAIAVETARRGAGLVVINFARSAEEAEETARQVEALGAKAVLARGDVADDADCRRIVEAAAPSGRIDALFNNAGMTRFAPQHGDLDAVNAEDFLKHDSVNVVGAFQMVRAARSLLEDAASAGTTTSEPAVIMPVVPGLASIPGACALLRAARSSAAAARPCCCRARVRRACMQRSLHARCISPSLWRVAGTDADDLSEMLMTLGPMPANAAANASIAVGYLLAPLLLRRGPMGA